jgi:ferredoxin
MVNRERRVVIRMGDQSASESRFTIRHSRWLNVDTLTYGPMPIVTVEGFAPVEVETGKRLVLAIEQDAGVDILHACGGNARCTTCRVEFISGEPARMTKAEQTKMAEKGLTGVRLSCQITCDHDMTVRAISRLAGSGRPDPGRTPEPTIQPPPEWI